MPLFTDGPVSSIEDLNAQDSQLLDVASTEGIDLTRKLELAQEDVGVELTALLSKLSYADQPFWIAPKPDLSAVVVTPALKRWHTYVALELVYCDAYNSQLNDRYAGKRDQFHQMAQWAREKLIQTGVGLVSQPVSRAATPVVTPIPGSLADGTYYVSMGWVNASGEEGASAAPAAMSIAASTLQVQPGTAPNNAAGWNVYIGLDAESMNLQNESLIGVGDMWRQNGPLVTAGRAPGTGQEPIYLKPLPRVIQRG
ncbi:MAG TPA: hypothetical protein VKT49_19780 [Bryobacteraceae bacterium]|nr:hypothetical protein [Bryobacteraceae bacterium]